MYPFPLHHIYINNILSEQEVSTCLQLAKKYAKETDSERHSLLSTSNYSDMDYFDFFCAHYKIPTLINTNDTDHLLESHQDQSLLSFTITLSNPTEFEGGGTFFEALRDIEPTTTNDALIPGGIIRPKKAGDCVFHCGKLLVFIE